MRTHLLFLVLIASIAHAEQSTDSTGDYYVDLGHVYGAAQGMKQYRDICTAAFPQLREKNEAAYTNWRRHHLEFLQEIERHWTALAWKEAGGEAKKHAEVLLKMSASIDEYKPALERELRADGDEKFKLKCVIYPKYLNTDRGNLEFFYAEQVITIRRGPK